MIGRPVTPDVLAQLREARGSADAAYNDALTALDRALPGAPALPGPTEPAPTGDLQRLNQLWRVLPESGPPPARGVRTRLARFVWNLVHPWIERQQAFNSVLVDHLNRTAAAPARTDERLTATIDAVAAYARTLAAFHSHLIVYLQQVTPYVDTKDRDVLAGLMAVYDPAISALADELQMRWESMQARERRFEARVTALQQAHDETLTTVASVQQLSQTLKRALERLPDARPAGASPAPGGTGAPAAAAAAAAFAGALDSHKYVAFENRFRGSPEDIRSRMESYVPLFAGAEDVLDVGCGRGEFLDLLQASGVRARGIDINPEMVDLVRERGLVAERADAVAYLESLPDGSLGGLFAAQVVEHLEPGYLLALIDAAYHKLRPGSVLVFETINPACWLAFFESYIRDITHVRPLHPETLQFLLQASGFTRVEIQWRAPCAPGDRLRPARQLPEEPPSAREVREAFNAAAERLNGLLFSYLDYAAIARRA